MGERARGAIRRTDPLLTLSRVRRSRASLCATTALQAAALVVLARPAAAQVAANARPAGGQVAAGSASIGGNATTTIIDQSSQSAVINWQTYNIGSAQTVRYEQPGTGSFTLNRVIAASPSQIAGHILANGRIAIVNQSGVVFLNGSTVDTAGLVVSAAGITNQDFMAGRLVFNQKPLPGAAISNAGNITIRQAGLAALVAPQVANSGTITAQLGRVILGGATTHTLDMYGDGLVALNVTGQVTQVDLGGRKVTALVTSTGTILAPGGTVMLTARAADGVVTRAITVGGSVSAPTLGGQTGRVLVSGIGGDVEIDGTVSASGAGTGGAGGQIAIGGTRDVTLASAALVDASGDTNGGAISLGTVASGIAANTRIAAGASVRANAGRTGNGGRIAIAARGAAAVQGSISARGGSVAGNGGAVTVNGAAISASGLIATTAVVGSEGTLGLTGNGTPLYVGDGCKAALHCTAYGNLAGLAVNNLLTISNAGDIDFLFNPKGLSNSFSSTTIDFSVLTSTPKAKGDSANVNFDAGVSITSPLISITSAGDIAFDTTLGTTLKLGNAASSPTVLNATGAMTLNAMGNITDLGMSKAAGASLSASSLTVTAAGTATLGNITTGLFTLVDSSALDLTGSIQAGNGSTITLVANSFSLQGAVTAPGGVVDIDLATPGKFLITDAAPTSANGVTIDTASLDEISTKLVSASGTTYGALVLGSHTADGNTVIGSSNLTVDTAVPLVLTTIAGTVELSASSGITLASGSGLSAAGGGTITFVSNNFTLNAPVSAPSGLVDLDLAGSGNFTVGGTAQTIDPASILNISTGALVLGSHFDVLSSTTITNTQNLTIQAPSQLDLTGVAGTLGLFGSGSIAEAASTDGTIYGIAVSTLYGTAGTSITLAADTEVAADANLIGMLGFAGPSGTIRSIAGGIQITDGTSLTTTAAISAPGGNVSLAVDAPVSSTVSPATLTVGADITGQSVSLSGLIVSGTAKTAGTTITIDDGAQVTATGTQTTPGSITVTATLGDIDIDGILAANTPSDAAGHYTGSVLLTAGGGSILEGTTSGEILAGSLTGTAQVARLNGVLAGGIIDIANGTTSAAAGIPVNEIGTLTGALSAQNLSLTDNLPLDIIGAVTATRGSVAIMVDSISGNPADTLSVGTPAGAMTSVSGQSVALATVGAFSATTSPLITVYAGATVSALGTNAVTFPHVAAISGTVSISTAYGDQSLLGTLLAETPTDNAAGPYSGTIVLSADNGRIFESSGNTHGAIQAGTLSASAAGSIILDSPSGSVSGAAVGNQIGTLTLGTAGTGGFELVDGLPTLSVAGAVTGLDIGIVTPALTVTDTGSLATTGSPTTGSILLTADSYTINGTLSAIGGLVAFGLLHDAGTFTVGTLTNGSAGTIDPATLANVVTNGIIDGTSYDGTLVLGSASGTSVDGTVHAASGGTWTASTSGSFAELAITEPLMLGTLTSIANTLGLFSNGNISTGPAAGANAITVGALYAAATGTGLSGGITLTAASNSIGTITALAQFASSPAVTYGLYSAGGDITLADASTLAVDGRVIDGPFSTRGSIDLTAGGTVAITLTAAASSANTLAVNADIGGQSVTLTNSTLGSGDAVTISGASVTAAGTAAGSITSAVPGTLAIGASTGTIDITGTVAALDGTGNAAFYGGLVELVASNGNVLESGAGVILAGTLSGQAGAVGAKTLPSAAWNMVLDSGSNVIGTLTDITGTALTYATQVTGASGTFSLTDSSTAGLAVPAGALIEAGPNITASPTELDLHLLAGNLSIAGTLQGGTLATGHGASASYAGTVQIVADAGSIAETANSGIILTGILAGQAGAVGDTSSAPYSMLLETPGGASNSVGTLADIAGSGITSATPITGATGTFSLVDTNAAGLVIQAGALVETGANTQGAATELDLHLLAGNLSIAGTLQGGTIVSRTGASAAYAGAVQLVADAGNIVETGNTGIILAGVFTGQAGAVGNSFSRAYSMLLDTGALSGASNSIGTLADIAGANIRSLTGTSGATGTFSLADANAAGLLIASGALIEAGGNSAGASTELDLQLLLGTLSIAGTLQGGTATSLPGASATYAGLLQLVADAGPISELSQGIILTGTLSGQAGDAGATGTPPPVTAPFSMLLNTAANGGPANHVSVLADIGGPTIAAATPVTGATGTFSLVDAIGLTIPAGVRIEAGPNSSAAATELDLRTLVGDIDIAGTLQGGTLTSARAETYGGLVNLIADAGNIEATDASGRVLTGTLAALAGGTGGATLYSVSLDTRSTTGAGNAIGTLTTSSATNTFSLIDDTGLTIASGALVEASNSVAPAASNYATLSLEEGSSVAGSLSILGTLQAGILVAPSSSASTIAYYAGTMLLQADTGNIVETGSGAVVTGTVLTDQLTAKALNGSVLLGATANTVEHLINTAALSNTAYGDYVLVDSVQIGSTGFLPNTDVFVADPVSATTGNVSLTVLNGNLNLFASITAPLDIALTATSPTPQSSGGVLQYAGLVSGGAVEVTAGREIVQLGGSGMTARGTISMQAGAGTSQAGLQNDLTVNGETLTVFGISLGGADSAGQIALASAGGDISQATPSPYASGSGSFTPPPASVTTGTITTGTLAVSATGTATLDPTLYNVWLTGSANSVGTLSGFAAAGVQVSAATGTLALTDSIGLTIPQNVLVEAGNSVAGTSSQGSADFGHFGTVDIAAGTAAAGDLSIAGTLQAGTLVSSAGGAYAGTMVLTDANGAIVEAGGLVETGSLAVQAGALQGSALYDVSLETATGNRIGTLSGVATAGTLVASASGSFALIDDTGLVIAPGVLVKAANSLALAVGTVFAGTLSIGGTLQAGTLAAGAAGGEAYAGSMTLTAGSASVAGSIAEQTAGSLLTGQLNARAVSGDILLDAAGQAGPLNVVQSLVGVNRAAGRFTLLDDALVSAPVSAAPVYLPQQTIAIDGSVQAAAITIAAAAGNMALEPQSGTNPGATLTASGAMMLSADLGLLQFGGALTANTIALNAGAEVAQFQGASIAAVAGAAVPAIAITAGTPSQQAGFAGDIVLPDGNSITLYGIALGGSVAAAGSTGLVALSASSGDISQAAPNDTTAPTTMAPPAATGSLSTRLLSFQAGTLTAQGGTLSNVWLVGTGNAVGTITGLGAGLGMTGSASGAAGAIDLATGGDLALAAGTSLTANGNLMLTLPGQTLTQQDANRIISFGSIQLNAAALVQDIGAAAFAAGDLAASGDVTQAAGSSIVASMGNASIGGSLGQSASTLSAGGNVTIATSLTQVSGDASAGGSLSVLGGGTLAQSSASTISGSAGVSLNLAGSLTQDGSSRILGGGFIAIQSAGGSLLAEGLIQTGTAADAYAGAITLAARAGSIVSATGTVLTGTLSASAGGSLLLDGRANTVGSISPRTALDGTALPGLEADGALALTDSAALSVTGARISGASVSMTIGGDFAETGGSAITAAAGVTLSGDGALTQDASSIDSAGGPVSLAFAGAVNQDSGGSVTGPSILLSSGGTIGQSGSLTASTGAVSIRDAGAFGQNGSIDGSAGVTIALTSGNLQQAAVASITSAAGPLLITGPGDLSFAGTLAAGQILLGETLQHNRTYAGDAQPATNTPLLISFDGGTIATGSSLKPMAGNPDLPAPIMPTSATLGLFADARGFVETGTTRITAFDGARQETVSLTLDTHGGDGLKAATDGAIAFNPQNGIDGLAGPKAQLFLDLGNAGVTSGNIVVAGLNLYAGSSFAAGGRGALSGSIAGRTGSAASASAFMHVNPNANYQVNACPIQSVSCVLLSPIVVPLGNPVHDFDQGVVRPRSDDDDLILPNVAEQDY